MIKAIFSEVKPSWYCEKCKKAHQILFIEGKSAYCERCFPKEKLKEVEFYNANNTAIKELDYDKVF